MAPVNVGIVGIGGYARAYTRVFDILEPEGAMRLRAAVIRSPAKYAEDVQKLEARGVVIYPSLDEMLAKDAANLGIVAVPTGIPEHRPMVVKVVEAGCDVVCEKPTAATIEDADAMIAACRRTGRFCQIGYQSQGKSYLRQLKRMVCDGKLGAIRNVAVRCSGYRRDSYYERNAWAGKLQDAQGRWVLDGGFNNPYSHQVMNALYFARADWNKTATPVRVRAELYHARDIESEDNACALIETAEGPTVYYCSTLVGPEQGPIMIEVVGDNGTALYDRREGVLIKWADGATTWLDDPGDDMSLELFRNAIQVHTGTADELFCPLEMTRSVVLATDGVFMSGGPPRAIPAEHLKIFHDEKADSRAVEVVDIADIIARGFAERKLFSDLGVPWAAPTEAVAVESLKKFEMKG